MAAPRAAWQDAGRARTTNGESGSAIGVGQTRTRPRLAGSNRLFTAALGGVRIPGADTVSAAVVGSVESREQQEATRAARARERAAARRLDRQVLSNARAAVS